MDFSAEPTNPGGYHIPTRPALLFEYVTKLSGTDEARRDQWIQTPGDPL